ncbi:MAG TPA: sigma-70 family RNA polymerase sigma factor, partial [Ignavibacteria bacterium]|nr:sigma-70 family RNA polymerase sigma factor [Ignavibacteria bacterium]
RFITYAPWWIKYFIRKTIFCKDYMIKIPFNVTELSYRLLKIEELHLLKTGNKIPDSELIIESGITKSKLEFIMNARTSNTVSLDTMNGNEYDNDFQSSYSIRDTKSKNPEEILQENELSKDIMDLLTILTPTELNVIKLRFAINCEENLSCREIGKMFNLSGEGVRQLEKRAIRKLKNGSKQLKLFNEL